MTSDPEEFPVHSYLLFLEGAVHNKTFQTNTGSTGNIRMALVRMGLPSHILAHQRILDSCQPILLCSIFHYKSTFGYMYDIWLHV